MSRRRTRNSNSNSSRISEDEINELVSKLRMILPEAPPVRPNTRVSASKVLEETCSYIKSLNREVGELSERLSQLIVDSSGSNDAQAAMLLQSLLMQ